MLDIGVAVDADQMVLVSEPSLALSDGYYWFLYPLIERLAEETGQYVDLYGDAVFAGGDLLALRRMLSEARGLVETRGESWEVRRASRGVRRRGRVRRGLGAGRGDSEPSEAPKPALLYRCDVQLWHAEFLRGFV